MRGSKRPSSSLGLGLCSVLLGASCAEGGPSVSQAELVPAGSFLTISGPRYWLDFARVGQGEPSEPQGLTLLNAGSANLSMSGVSLVGNHPGDFSFTAGTTCSASTILAPGATCRVEVAFTPGALGSRSARISIANDAAGNPHLIPLAGTGIDPNAINPEAGPIDLRHGFPVWYQDAQGTKLELCVEDTTPAGLCLTSLADTSLPPLVADSGSNFVDESFYWTAEAEITRANGGKVRLVLAAESAFLNEDIIQGDQMVFGRIRYRVDRLTAGATYTITHPFGTETAVADEDGEIDVTHDIGCAAGPCEYRAALSSPVFQSFLKWDPAFAPAAPAGFLGDPNVTHRIIGSPTGNNRFRVQGPNVGGAGVNSIQTQLFRVSGKIAP